MCGVLPQHGLDIFLLFMMLIKILAKACCFSEVAFVIKFPFQAYQYGGNDIQ